MPTPTTPTSRAPAAVTSDKFDSTSPLASRKHVASSRIVVHGDRGVKVTRSVTIRRSPEDLYTFWRDIENLAQIMEPDVVIERLSDIASHWSVRAPGDGKVEWDAAIINDVPGQLVAWRSREGSELPNAGTVRFERVLGSDETEVTVVLEYDPPAGKLGALVTKFSGAEPGRQIEQALGRLKELMESETDD